MKHLEHLKYYLQSPDPAQKPWALVLIGAPGSGKSSLVREYQPIDATVISSDAILELLAEEQQITYNQAIQNYFGFVVKMMNLQLDEAIKAGRSLIIDRTNMSIKARAKILARVPANYRRYAAVLSVNRVELDRRLAKRAAETNKEISASVVDELLDNFVFPSYDEFHEVFV